MEKKINADFRTFHALHSPVVMDRETIALKIETTAPMDAFLVPSNHHILNTTGNWHALACPQVNSDCCVFVISPF